VDDRGWPPLILQRCDTALIHDRLEHRWWGLGSDAPDLLRLLADAPPAPDRVLGIAEPLQDPHARARYTGAVADAIGLIHAGDAYQVNLAHRLTWHFRGSPLALFRRVAIRAVPWYGGFMRFHHEGRDHALCSASPELLLGLDARSRIVTTRPMKGTRPGRSGSDELRDAPKDRAELAMIVDLARNDLGRVCRLGSVRVREPRELETHAGGDVLQATATVAGVLRRDRSLLDLVRALFPAASVTGAPKIRAMQIIDRLEAVRRGPYCGALGFVSDCGNAAFNVMIRTGAIVGTPCPDGTVAGTLDYAVGAGIVADSDPEAEWEETLVKARPFIRALERPAPFLPHPVSTTRQ
jgi:anthranilate/para-aminobenzoate synthase component I